MWASMKVRHILLTSDLSAESQRPCKPIAELARQLGSRITLLHVVQELAVAAHGAPLAPPLRVGDIQKEIQRAQTVLQEQAAALGQDLEVKVDVITGTSTAEAIAQYARQHAVDLIALSTHGRTGLRHLVLGSVAEAVLRHAPVPVVCFPQPRG
jgi:nucleotide-binding universal stress UspA family protein